MSKGLIITFSLSHPPWSLDTWQPNRVMLLPLIWLPITCIKTPLYSTQALHGISCSCVFTLLFNTIFFAFKLSIKIIAFPNTSCDYIFVTVYILFFLSGNSFSPCLLGGLLFIHLNSAYIFPPREIFMTSFQFYVLHDLYISYILQSHTSDTPW